MLSPSQVQAMSVTGRLCPPSPAFFHHRSFDHSPDLSVASPAFCGRSACSNAWVACSPSPTPCSPCNQTRDKDLTPETFNLRSHLNKCLRSPDSRSSLGSDMRLVGKDDMVNARGLSDRRDLDKGLLGRKRPGRLAIPETARLASLQKASLFILPEQQDCFRQEAELFAVAAKRGQKDYMEDSYSVCPHFQGNSKQAFFGVFDGHGGKQAAQFLAAKISQNVAAALEDQKDEITTLEDAMYAAYMSTDAEFLSQHTSSGACAVSVLMKEGEMVVSNAGDCKAVLCRSGQAECLSVLHRASNEVERQRIEDLGGFVDQYNGTWRLQHSLAITRGFGDASLKQWVSAEPETKRTIIDSDCDFLILASDGLWDQLSEQEAVDCARKVLASEMDSLAHLLAKTKQDKLPVFSSLINACEELIRIACCRGNRDDITVMIVPLQSFAIAC